MPFFLRICPRKAAAAHGDSETHAQNALFSPIASAFLPKKISYSTEWGLHLIFYT